MKYICIVHPQNILGEGPCWSVAEQVLYWVDIKGRSFYRYNPSDNITSKFSLPEEIGAIVPRTKGGWVAAISSGLAFISDPSLTVHPITNPESHLPGNRFNDGKCDAVGRFWAGTMDNSEQDTSGSLYCLDLDGTIRTMETNLGISNGLGWSPDNSIFYLTDSPKKTIYSYDFNLETGTIDNRRIFTKVPDGKGWPDGLTVDADGYVWSAHWDGCCLTRYTPDGMIDLVIPLPIPRPTSIAFGGPELERLFITSARTGLSQQELEASPLSGAILAIDDLGISGLPEPLFAGYKTNGTNS